MSGRGIAALLLGLGIAASSSAARADGKSFVARARRHYEAVEYGEAHRALEDALRAGENDPATTAEIYELLGQVNAGRNQPAMAKEYFKKLLVLRPAAVIPTDRGPRITGPFEAARTAMSGVNPITVRAEVAPRPRSRVTLRVESDPLTMIAGARASFRIGRGGWQEVRAMGRSRVELTVPAAATEMVISALDEHGNRLVDVVTSRPSARATEGGGGAAGLRGARAAPPAGDGPSLWTHYVPWAGASAVFAGVGVGFALDARSKKDELDSWRGDDEGHPYSEWQDLERRGKRSTVLADIAFAAAGATAVVSAVCFIWRRGGGDAEGTVSVAPVNGGAVVGLARSF